jgi:stress response protein SCP2
LTDTRVELIVDSRGVEADVSALLVGANGKVRTDSDLVFYNNPKCDGVSVADQTVTAQLNAIPGDVASVVVIASADPTDPGTVFTAAPHLTISQQGSGLIGFAPPEFTARETVVVLAELYRHSGRWKVRAVGQGYASGLAGLATDYGVAIDDDIPVAAATRSGRPTAGAGGTVDLVKVESRAPALVGPARQAGAALAKVGIAGQRAAVHLILSHDYGMKELYESFAIQAFAERVLALSANLDDDGTVPVVFAGEREPFLEEIGLDNYRGRIGELHTQVDWGWGHTVEAMRLVVSHYQSSAAADPAVVIVQVSDEPHDKAEIRSLLQNTAALGMFWIFVGFGQGNLAFFKNFNASRSATFRNVTFYEAGKNPGAVPDDKFYTGLVKGYAAWLNR